MVFKALPAKAIKRGTRHRMDDGDLDSLAASIADVGLLQPIAVDEYYHLICGWRRCVAWFDILKRSDPIPAVVLNLKSILAGEFAENEFRKNFTKSERIAIGRALEKEAGERRGRPPRGSKAVDSTGVKIKEKFPEFSGKQTRDLAAKVAGFKNPRTYEQAKKVVEKGIPELAAAMDTGNVSVSAASHIAQEPAEKQRQILAMPKDERHSALARARKTAADEEARRETYVYRNFYDAIKLVANFSTEPGEVWAAMWRVAALDFTVELLDRAISSLNRLRKGHPNEPRRPEIVKAVL